MRTPDNRAHKRPQETVLERKQKPRDFDAATEMHLSNMSRRLEDHEELEKVIAYLNGTIVARNISDINESLCTKIIRENPFVAKHLEIKVPAEKSAPIELEELGKLAAFLRILIQKRDDSRG